MFRVYDNKKHYWHLSGEKFFISLNGDLYMAKKTLFGTVKLTMVTNHRYTYQNSIGLCDMNKVMIFEGDICKIEHLDVCGVIAYITELACYCLLDDKELKYYPLDEEHCRQLKIIGNVFDNDLSEENTEEV
jgi:hypothetical protein